MPIAGRLEGCRLQVGAPYAERPGCHILASVSETAFREHAWREWLVVVSVASIVTAWFVAPVITFADLGSALYRGDVRLNAWALAWNHQALSGRTADYWNANIFHPASGTLACSEEWFATRQWFPIVNGYSRVEPVGHADLMSTLQTFPSEDAFRALSEPNVKYVVAHAQRPFADFRPAIAAGLAHPRLRRIARSGEDVLWALTCT